MTIQEFFSAPVVNRSYKIDRIDPKWKRFGLMWKVFDRMGQKGVDFQLPILDVPSLKPFGETYLWGEPLERATKPFKTRQE